MKQELFNRLSELCEGVSHDTLRTVILGIDETIIDFGGTINIDITEEVLSIIKNPDFSSELFDNIYNFDILNDEIDAFVETLNEGSNGDVTVEQEFDEDTLLIEIVIYALEISL